MQKQPRSVTMEDLFRLTGNEYQTLEIGQSIDISEKNIKIESFNLQTGKKEFKKILSIIRKQDSEVFEIIDSHNSDVLLRASGGHRIWLHKTDEWKKLEDIVGLVDLNLNCIVGRICYVNKTGKFSPILDIEVEDNQNYFANSILSHNTTPGGNALKFAASIRLDIRKIEAIMKGSGDNAVAIGIRSRVKNIKNKTCPPFRKGEIEIYFDRGIDTFSEYITMAMSTGVIARNSSTYSYGDFKVSGKEKMIAYLKENMDVYEKLKLEVQTLMSGGGIEIEEMIGLPVDENADFDEEAGIPIEEPTNLEEEGNNFGMMPTSKPTIESDSDNNE